MPIEESDYFGWYNDEITRYRDLEWQLSAYSIGISIAIILFAQNSDTKNLIAPWVEGLSIGIMITLLFIGQIHIHQRLNEYRERRSLLINKKDHIGDISAPFFRGAFDTAYFLGFVSAPLLLGAGAVWILLNL
ncbi:MAG: hypothetical protein KKA35_14470 [Proteobacteria bacterium]|nr:hypothetical protein [Pseudomonadota bacterium]